MKHKVAELEAPLLDAAVAKVEGHEYSLVCGIKVRGGGIGGLGWMWVRYSPSSDWKIGGPIIQRERIDVLAFEDGWAAGYEYYEDGAFMRFGVHGCATPLIAAMRAFCASRFGEEVEL